MQLFPVNSQAFQPDQRYQRTVTYWNTPYTPLEGTAASSGLIMDLRERIPGVAWDMATRLAAAPTPAAALTAYQLSTASNAVVTDGRTPNVVEYWAGGAPGWHGATQRGKVAYHFRCYARSAAARAWFSPSTTLPLTLALGGNGYFRVDVNNTLTLYSGEFTERMFLGTGGDGTGGLLTLPSLSLNAGDYLDIYYVQRDQDAWGGFVAKAILGPVGEVSPSGRQRAVREAPVLGCGLFDDDAQRAGTLTPQTLSAVGAIEIVRERDAVASCTVTLPLINPTTNDGNGYVWTQADGNDPGFVTYYTNNVASATLRRGRLMQISTGFQGEAQTTVFTGYIDDFDPDVGGTLKVTLLDFTQRLMERFDKGQPDKIDYMTYSYRNRLGATEPVYEIPALDNWPMEYALEMLAVRSGIDASRLRRSLTVPKSDGTVATVAFENERFLKFRARAMNGKLIRLERPVHYGNYGSAFTETHPADDEYIFKPEATKEVWQRVRAITDRYGYDLRFDELGDLVLRVANAPHYVYDFATTDFSAGAPQEKSNPNAYGGTYIEVQTVGSESATKTVAGARLDVVVGRYSGSKGLAYTVTRVSDSAVMATGTLSITAASAQFFYDFRSATDGSNACVFTLYTGDFDTYLVTLTGNGAGTGQRLDAMMVYHTDPVTPKLPATLATTKNALAVRPKDTSGEMRNFVIVVGRRRALVTDSEKLVTNPNNPEGEFAVAAGVNVGSIVDRTRADYMGYPRESVIFDSGITDQDFAEYLARAFIYRYRNPRPGATVEHTLLPQIQVRDPVFALEDRFRTITTQWTLFVKSVRHLIGATSATTTLECTSYPEYPSYEPRNDIDIDRKFYGQPVANLQISYTGLDGTSFTNLTSTAIKKSLDAPINVASGDAVGDIVEHLGVTVSAGTLPMPTNAPWPPVPGTVFIRPATISTATGTTVVTTADNVLLRADESAALSTVYANLQGIQSVTARVQGYVVGRGYQELGSNVSIASSRAAALAGSIPIYYEKVGPDRSPAIVLRRIGGGLFANFFLSNISVTWTQGLQDSGRGDWITNTPYHQFFTVNYPDNTTTGRSLSLDWVHGGDGPEYDRNPAVTQFDVRYRRVTATGATGSLVDPYLASGSPFFDPYTSELGYLVNTQFDLLVSGLVRVSVRNRTDDTVVAWLTEPAAQSIDPEAHWSYLTAGSGKQFLWDGVDAIGDWNLKQSDDYATAAQGAFEQDQRPLIGAGYYAWNRERDAGLLAPLAVISAKTLPGSGYPQWGAGCQGTYGAWYVMVEVTNDDLQRIASEPLTEEYGLNLTWDAKQVPRVVRSYSMDARVNTAIAGGSPSEALIFTHLAEPTKLTLSVADWLSASGSYDDTNLALSYVDANWGAPDTSYTLNNYKPVRVRFAAARRPGPLWDTQSAQDSLSFKLTRVAHMKALIFDQFVVFNGSAYADSHTESKSLVNRRLANDSHTVKYEDAGYRRANSFRSSAQPNGLEWVFQPKQFKKNWRGIENEPIQFGDYLQLEEVPKFDASRQVGGTRARLQLAMMGYLWYLSAYTTDRSGRSVWAINPSFGDQSKMPTNHGTLSALPATTITWPDDPMRQLRRSIICRQWVDERVNPWTTWQEYQRQLWGMTTSSPGYYLLKTPWIEHDPTSTTLTAAGGTFPNWGTDEWSSYHQTAGELTSLSGWAVRGTASPEKRQLRVGDLGTWLFEPFPTWQPSLTRDFSPFHLLPPMSDPTFIVVNDATGWFGFKTKLLASAGALYDMVDNRAYDYDNNVGNDAAAGDVWSSGIFDQTETATNRKRFWVGSKIQKEQDPILFAGNTVPPHALDYQRQDDMQHWEDFRGCYSRGPRPAEQPKKVTPTLPYYVNPFIYDAYYFIPARNNTAYGKWFANLKSRFSLKFRGEYVWESASMFPVDDYGVENLKWFNHEKARLFTNAAGLDVVRYDNGAWVGFKDDTVVNYAGGGSATILGLAKGDTNKSIFDSGRMAQGVGPQTYTTREMYMHLVLVNERRETPTTTATPTLGSAVTTSIVVTPNTLNGVSVGGSYAALFTATVNNSDGNPLADQKVVWTVDNPALCQLTPDGSRQVWVAARGTGTTTLRATQNGVQGTVSLVVTGAATGVSLSIGSGTLLVGQATTLTATTTTTGAVTLTTPWHDWYTSDPAVAGVKLSGSRVTSNTITAVAAGSTTVGVSVDGVNASAVVTTVRGMFVYAPGTPVNYSSAAPGSTLPPGTFTRALAATYTDVSGVTQTAATGVLRDNHFDSGSRTLLLELSRTNLALWSMDFTNATWAKTSVTVSGNVVTAPDGTLTADKFYEVSGASALHSAQQSVTVTSGGNVATSVYVKAAERFRFEIVLSVGTSFAQLDYRTDSDVLTSAGGAGGTVVRTGRTLLTNGWVRLEMVSTLPGTAAVMQCRLVQDAGANNYVGDPTKGGYFWGAQVENGALYQTSFIPTFASTVTRPIDAYSVPFYFTPQAMTWYVKFYERGFRDGGGSTRLLTVSTAAENNPRAVMYNTGAGYGIFHQNALSQQSAASHSYAAYGDLVELRAVFNPDGSVLMGKSVNGAAESLSATGAAAPFASAWSDTSLWIGHRGGTAGTASLLPLVAVKCVMGVQSLTTMRALIAP